jgi:excisionase family DNA binding protein
MRDAATVLGISERMVYSLVEIGELVAVRLPGTGSRRSAVRIARVDLLDFVERRRAAVRMAR